MSNSLDNSQNLKTIINPVDLGFIPVKFWQQSKISISDFISFLTNANLQNDSQSKKQQFAKFNHKLWCILRITTINNGLFDLFGAKWKDNTKLIIEINNIAFSNFFANKNQENLINLFHTNGWQKIDNNDSKTLLFTIDEKSCLNNELFDIEFYEQLVKFSNKNIIENLSDLLSKSLLSLIQNENTEKSINYTSKSSEFITLNNNFNDDLILDDVVHFVTFPGEIVFEQTKQDKGSIKKIFNKIGKDQLLFDESSFDMKYQGNNVILELPPFDYYSLFPVSKEFSQSMIIINSMIIFTDDFKKSFFEKCIELSQKTEDSRTFFEFISVVYILLKSHQFDLKSYDPIFMSQLFDDYATVYNYSEDYQKILYLREQWINLSFGFTENMMNTFIRKFSFFKNIFKKFRTHPIGFSEFALIVSRIFSKLTAESQNYIMLLMAQTNVYYFDCMKSIFLKNYDKIKNDEIQLNNHFAYQQMMNVRKLFNFDCRAQFDINFNQLNNEDKKKVNAIIQARFSILTFFYKNFNVIFKCDRNQPLNAYQYKTFKLILTFSFEISLQKQTLSLIDSNEYFYNNSNSENDFSFFEHFCKVYFKMFNKKANDIITINFCDNLINHLHNKIYKILSIGINKDSKEISWISFLLEIFPNIIYWYSLIDINFVPIDMIQLSICNTISFMTSCLYLSSIPQNYFLYEQFKKVFNSLYNDLENICIFYFVNIESYRDLVFKKLLNLASERELKSIYTHFTIKFGKAIKILLKLFFNESTLSYLNDICYLDIRNCYQLTECGVDILLIDYLYDNRNNANASNRSLITSVLQLAKTLSYQHSSNEFVKKFISIFTPINGSFLPYYLPLFVSALDDLSMKEARFPVVSVPLLQDKCNLNVFSIDPKIINDGVTFSFWIFINNSITKNPRKILIIKQKLETKERKVVLILNPNRRFSFIVSDDDGFIGNTKNQISEGKWHFVMVSVSFRFKELKMRIQTNDSLLYKNKIDDEINTIMNSFEKDTKYVVMPKSEIGDFSQFFKFPKFDENQKIQICIGEEDKSTYFASNDSNNNENNVDFRHIQSEDLIKNSNKNILLGPIGMFPLLEDDSEYLYYMFNTVDKIPSKSLFYAYPFEISNGVVILKFESAQFNSVSYPIEFEFNSSFVNILIKSNLTDKLIILFGLNYLRKQSNTIRLESLEKSFIFKEADDNFYFDYTNAVIGIFRNIFSISEEAQNEIVNVNGFHLISHLLYSTFDETIKVNELIANKFHSFSLDFFLYKNLVSLFESITIKTAQQQFLSDILFNFELWIKSKDFDLILNNWYTSLIPEFYTEFFNKYTIVSMLTLMRLYLYYEPMEKSIIIPIRKMNNEKVKNCRKIFWSIISSSDRFNKVDLSTMISHATTCPDFHHVEEIINFISEFFDYKVKLSLSEEKNAVNQEVIPQKKKFLQFFQDISIIKNTSNMQNTTNASNQTNKLNNIDFQDYNSLLQLTLLISCNNIEIVKKIIVLFIKLYQMQLLNDISFEDYFDLICMNLQIFKDPNYVLNEILKYFCPQILSLCIVIAIQAKSDESLTKVIEVMETFEKPETFCVSKNWFLWPVISCFMCPHCYERMIDIFVKCPQSEWPKIYNTILIVGHVMNTDSKSFLHYFISRISSNLCIRYDDFKANVFFMMAFYYLFISFDTNNNKYDSKVDTQEIIRRIMTLDEFYQSRSFKIELDDHDCLVNADVAQVALSLFEIKHSKIYSDFIVILSAYQLYFEKSPLERFKKMNCITKSDAFYYYDVVALKLNKDLLTKDDPQKIYVNQAEYMKNFVSKFDSFFTPLNTNIFVKYIQANFQKIDYKYKVFLNDKYHNMSSHLFKNYADHLQMITISFKKQWDLFWLFNSKENDSIFHYNIQTDNTHFKRDNSNCFYYCPFKLIKNKQFNDHLKESLFRDLGNIEKAEIQYQRIKSENKTNENELFKIDTTNEIKSKKEQIFELQNDENIIYQTNECERKKPDESYFVTFIIFVNKLKIGKRIILLEEIKSVFLRYVQQHQTAIEIFLTNGKSYFLNFPNILNSFTIVSKIQQAEQINNPYSKSIIFQSTCNNQFFFENNQFTQKWVNGEMSNFEYLMMLNIYCGRTFNDAKFYPVMPWIIQDYDSNELNLNDPNIFRDLSLPIGAVNEKRYNMLYKSFKASKNPETLFLYSSWLICPLSLYVWLVRLEPFTTNHTKMQSGKFDVEQRIFHSIKAAYELCTHDNNDFRELIPEFFFQPEFLVNMNNFDLGETMKQNNSSDVKLPKWAKTPFEFIYKHRKALECDFVSKNLNKWIDLIFGCNQNNESFKNVYRRELYSDVWETELGKEPQNADRIRCSLDLLGQIPHPLFNSPHPEKNILTAEEMMKKCEEKWPSKEFKLSIEKDLDLNENKSMEITNNIFIIYSIVNNENDVDNSIIRNYLYLYCLRFVFIDSNQKKLTALTYLLKYEMKPNSIDFVSSSLLFVEPLESDIKSLNISSNFIKNISKHGFALAIGSCVYLTFNLLSKSIENQKKFKITNEIGCIFEKVAVCSLYLAAINSDSNALYIFNQKMKNEKDSLLFKIYLNDYVNNDSISCIAISDIFHLCVCCTKNKSSIIIVSLNKGDVERVVPIENEGEIEIPQKTLITSSWGFILVLTLVQNKKENDSSIKDSRYRFHLFNINGYFIGKSGLFKLEPLNSSNTKSETSLGCLNEIQLSQICSCREKENVKFICWKSIDGFDFVLLADSHSVYNFEAFEYEKAPGKPILTFTNEIIGLDFIEEAMKVIVTLDDGKVVVSNIMKK